jgi:NADPH-dependent glutamate synthase beta subunit-like oxidoreductase
MAENKTKQTDASVEDYIASRANEEQRADCKALMSILERITKQQPKMWGPSIVGYGSIRYTYESGRTGEMFLAGFAIRGRELVVYLVPEGRKQAALLSRLGKHKMGKSCLYFKRLADLDKTILEELVANSVLDVTRRYGTSH